MSRYSKAQIAEARGKLLEILKPGDTVYTVLRHVSRSGMRRRISLFYFKAADHGEVSPLWLDGYAAQVLDLQHPADSKAGDGLSIDGAGMDMGFHLVYSLSRVLFNGYCDGSPRGKRGRHVPHSNNGPACEYRDGGYALQHRWL